MLTLNWKKAERAYGSQPWCREEISMGMRYDGEKQEPGKRNNVIIVALCIAILILTFMLFIINISRLRNLFSSDNRKRPTENTQGSNVVMSGPADGEEPQAGGEDDSVGANPAEEEEPVEEAAEEPAEEEEEEEAVEGEEEDPEADNIIAFADPVFKDAVRRALRITDKDVRVRDTYGVRSLLLENNSADNSKIIDDLTGLADFRDLKEFEGLRLSDTGYLLSCRSAAHKAGTAGEYDPGYQPPPGHDKSGISGPAPQWYFRPDTSAESDETKNSVAS